MGSVGCRLSGYVKDRSRPSEYMADDSLDLEEIQRKAEIVAEATGRKVEDVVIDLLDDGEANFSAGSDSKDMFDVAQEKAEKVKALIITLMPIIALLGAGGLEGFGIVDVTGWGEDSVWDEDPYDYPEPVRYGCTDPMADNYDETAEQDDGSCWYEPECEWDWQWVDHSWVDQDNKSLTVEMEFSDVEGCDDAMNGHFEIILIDENDHEIDWGEHPDTFYNNYYLEHEFTELDPHTYQVEVNYIDNSGSHWTSPHTPVFNIPQEEPTNETGGETEVDCTPYLYDGSVAFDNGTNQLVAIYDVDTDCEEIEIQVYLDVGKYNQNRTNLTYVGWNETLHNILGQQGNYDMLRFDNVTNGTYLARVTVYYDGEQAFYYERDVEVIRDE